MSAACNKIQQRYKQQQKVFMVFVASISEKFETLYTKNCLTPKVLPSMHNIELDPKCQ